MQSIPAGASPKNCEQCGSQIKAIPSVLAKRSFCSKTCAGAARKTPRTPKRVKLSCARCGAEFEVYPGVARVGNVKYCGKVCRIAEKGARAKRANPMAGRNHTPEARGKMSAASKGRCLMERSARWKGGQFVDSYGYRRVMVATLPPAQQSIALTMAVAKGGTLYVLEHRVVAALARGIPIGRDEVVHHKNGVKTDNRPENLEVVPRAGHSKEHRLVEKELALLRVEAARLRAENEILRAQVADLKLKKARSPKSEVASLSLFS